MDRVFLWISHGKEKNCLLGVCRFDGRTVGAGREELHPVKEKQININGLIIKNYALYF